MKKGRNLIAKTPALTVRYYIVCSCVGSASCCCTDTLQGSFELSYNQEKTIQDVRKQIEECLPDIMERIQQQDTEPTQEQTM